MNTYEGNIGPEFFGESVENKNNFQLPKSITAIIAAISLSVSANLGKVENNFSYDNYDNQTKIQENDSRVQEYDYSENNIYLKPSLEDNNSTLDESEVLVYSKPDITFYVDNTMADLGRVDSYDLEDRIAYINETRILDISKKRNISPNILINYVKNNEAGSIYYDNLITKFKNIPFEYDLEHGEMRGDLESFKGLIKDIKSGNTKDALLAYTLMISSLMNSEKPEYKLTKKEASNHFFTAFNMESNNENLQYLYTKIKKLQENGYEQGSEYGELDKLKNNLIYFTNLFNDSYVEITSKYLTKDQKKQYSSLDMFNEGLQIENGQQSDLANIIIPDTEKLKI